MKWAVLIALGAAFVGVCSAQVDCFGEGLPNSPKTTAVAKGADDFGLELFANIAASYPRNSIVLSPYSVWSVLNLAYFGAGGRTEVQLKNALKVPSKSDAFYGGKIIESSLRLNQGTTFNKADKAYFAQDVRLRNCAIQKLTEVERVDFTRPQEAADKINGDVSDVTFGKITEFLSPSVVEGARFILLNAVYFKGLWTYPFLPTRTKQKPFYDENRNKEIGKAKMMSGEAKLRYVESNVLKATVLELPYDKSNIAMFLILPFRGEPVNSVLKLLTSDSLLQVTRDFQVKTVIMSLPRFKMTTRIADELTTALTKVGITDLFNINRANLTNFVTSEAVAVSKSLHHATIEVTEEGTVAAAATALIGTRSGSSDTKVFNAERPFIFLIRDVSQGITLFMGVFRDPAHNPDF